MVEGDTDLFLPNKQATELCGSNVASRSISDMRSEARRQPESHWILLATNPQFLVSEKISPVPFTKAPCAKVSP